MGLFHNLLKKLPTLEKKSVWRILRASFFLFIGFVPAYKICYIHEDFLKSKTFMTEGDIQNVTIAFIVMIMLGTVLGCFFWAVTNTYEYMFCVFFIETLVFITLLTFSFFETQDGGRLICILMVIGILIGIIQVTVTTLFADQYEDNAYYSLLHHFMLYIFINVIIYIIVKLTNPDTQRDIKWYTYSYIWEILLIIICNIISMWLVFVLSKDEETKKSTGFDITRIDCINLNQLKFICLLYCPFIVIWCCIKVLQDQWIHQFNCNMDPMIGQIIIRENHIFFIGWVIFVLVPIIPCIFNIRQNDFYRIKLGLTCIIAGALLSALIYSDQGECYKDQKISPDTAIIRILPNDGATWHLQTKSQFLGIDFIYFQNVSYYNKSMKAQGIYGTRPVSPCKENLEKLWGSYDDNFQSNMYFEGGVETWNFICMGSGGGVYQFSKVLKIYRRSSGLPVVFFIQNGDVDSHGNTIRITSDQFDLNLTNRAFHEILPNNYSMRHYGTLLGTQEFRRGGLYVILWFKKSDNSKYAFGRDVLSVQPIIPPYKYNIILLAPQFLLLMLGQFMVVQSVLKLSYNLPNAKIKCEAFAVFFFMIDTSYLLHFIVYVVMNMNWFESKFILAILIALSTCFLYMIEYLFDYRLLSSEIQTINYNDPTTGNNEPAKNYNKPTPKKLVEPDEVSAAPEPETPHPSHRKSIKPKHKQHTN